MHHIPDLGGISTTVQTKFGSNKHRSKIFLRVVSIFLLYKSRHIKPAVTTKTRTKE